MSLHRNSLSTSSLSPLDLLLRAAKIEIAHLPASIPSTLLNDLKNPDSLAFKMLMNEWMDALRETKTWDVVICMQCIQKWLENLSKNQREVSAQRNLQEHERTEYRRDLLEEAIKKIQREQLQAYQHFLEALPKTDATIQWLEKRITGREEIIKQLEQSIQTIEASIITQQKAINVLSDQWNAHTTEVANTLKQANITFCDSKGQPITLETHTRICESLAGANHVPVPKSMQMVAKSHADYQDAQSARVKLAQEPDDAEAKDTSVLSLPPPPPPLPDVLTVESAKQINNLAQAMAALRAASELAKANNEHSSPKDMLNVIKNNQQAFQAASESIKTAEKTSPRQLVQMVQSAKYKIDAMIIAKRAAKTLKQQLSQHKKRLKVDQQTQKTLLTATHPSRPIR